MCEALKVYRQAMKDRKDGKPYRDHFDINGCDLERLLWDCYFNGYYRIDRPKKQQLNLFD